MTEGFKKGDFDLYAVNGSKVWAVDLTGDRFDALKWIKKELLPNENDQGAQGFVFNLRNPVFQDVRVRKAMALAFDFDWSNKNLFYNQYTEDHSYFENSPLKATGLPTADELKILEPLKADLPPEVFAKEMGYLGKGKDTKDRLREAVALLKEAGYTVKDGVAQGPAGRLELKFLIDSPMWQRIVEPYTQNLKKLGINVTIEEKEESVYIKRVENREYDLIVYAFGESESPGNEQRDYWTSAAADHNYSSNYAGIKSKAIDALVDRVIYAKSRDELVLATHCLDRALYHLHPMVLNWYTAAHRLAYWDKFSRPAQLPLFYYPPTLEEYMWFDTAKAQKLEDAKSKGTPLL
jgi:microcin C transport system substrate-binding protein